MCAWESVQQWGIQDTGLSIRNDQGDLGEVLSFTFSLSMA